VRLLIISQIKYYVCISLEVKKRANEEGMIQYEPPVQQGSQKSINARIVKIGCVEDLLE
jgi:hypothetical protein